MDGHEVVSTGGLQIQPGQSNGFRLIGTDQMRIALNLHGFVPGCGGVETYIANLLEILPLVGDKDEYLVLCDSLTAKWLENSANSGLSVEILNFGEGHWQSSLRVALRKISGVDLLARALRNLNADVIHHPLTILNPRGLHLPAVLTFHDMQHEFFPEFFSSSEIRNRNANYRPSLTEARAIITVSAHAKQGLTDHYGISPEKIHVIHHGYADCFRPVDDLSKLAEVTQKYALDKPFMIYPAATWAHKNHLKLLAAVRKMVDDLRFDGELLLTGGPNSFHTQVMTEIPRLGLVGQVRWLGQVPLEDLPRLYSLARLMVFPSLFEGFGLPLLEAMACGCPVACANTTALPEVADDAAHYFDPESIDDISDKVGELWKNISLQKNLRMRGFSRVKSFSWKKTVRQTLEVYRKVVETMEEKT